MENLRIFPFSTMVQSIGVAKDFLKPLKKIN